jgi:magnesium-transporting ATPase (P-type)
MLKMCSHYYSGDKIRPIDDYFMKNFDKIYTKFGKSGERVLGFASLDISNDGV